MQGESAVSERAKPGFFARLFRSATEAEDSPAIEVHEDRIDAAAHALDQVGQEQFESFEGRSSSADRSFASVEDALPAATASAPAKPPVLETPSRTAADAPSPAVDETLTLGELTQPSAKVDANSTTGEAPLVFIPALEDIDVPAAPAPGATRGGRSFDGDSTQDIEIKTDEFEIAALEGPTHPMDLAPKRSWTGAFLARLFRRSDAKLEAVAADADAARVSSAFLLAKFRAFYNEIIRLQHQKSEFIAGFATAILADVTVEASPDAAAEALSKRLSELLELQIAEAKWMGGEAGLRYPDAQYAMAALADELFTHSEWEGQAAWPKFSLERKLHKSHDAEMEVFRRIDRLLKESPDSVVARDLARVYLLVLAAGFKGKWRPFGLTRPLAEYRRRLYEYIYGADALMLYASDRRVCPDAATRTLEGHAVSRFSALQRWVAVVVFLVVSYTVVAHIAWSRASADLQDVTGRIKTGGGDVGGAAAGEVSRR
ncbi:MAG TPA: DotU family type IV/VI secretion system protein [Gemmatimonadaceae bacterium]|nr:DotU family type IV/VI secretion system protein [Gemmatimonadaceae bacterium]